MEDPEAAQRWVRMVGMGKSGKKLVVEFVHLALGSW